MVLILVIFLGIITISQEQVYLIGPSKTYPQHFPYHAYIKSDLYCLGALISTRYVLVNAICIETRVKAKVYLGTVDNPFYVGNDQGQLIRSTELITHPQFSKRYNDKLLVHNIGLVKLLDNALITPTVQPISLSRASDFPLPAGTLVNITGYMDGLFDSNSIHFMTARVKRQNDCYMYYGQSFMKDDEQCLEGPGEDRLDWPGAIAMGGRLVGLARVLSREAPCLISSPPCSPRDVFLTLGPYLDWIYENSDVPRPFNRNPPTVLVQRPLDTFIPGVGPGQRPFEVLVQRPPETIITQISPGQAQIPIHPFSPGFPPQSPPFHPQLGGPPQHINNFGNPYMPAPGAHFPPPGPGAPFNIYPYSPGVPFVKGAE